MTISSTTPAGRIADALNYCEGDFKKEQMIQSKITTVVLAIFFVSLLGVGMGQTAVYTLGIPYIDDNVASRESPLYFGELFRLRVRPNAFTATTLADHRIGRTRLRSARRPILLAVDASPIPRLLSSRLY